MLTGQLGAHTVRAVPAAVSQIQTFELWITTSQPLSSHVLFLLPNAIALDGKVISRTFPDHACECLGDAVGSKAVIEAADTMATAVQL